jgi:hypothetical protein
LRRHRRAVDREVAVDDVDGPLLVRRVELETAAGREPGGDVQRARERRDRRAQAEASPAITVSDTPPSSRVGGVSAAWCSNDGSVVSCATGSATQVWIPCTVWPLSRSASGVRSEWTIPRPAVIQLTSPGTISCSEPRLSRCRIAPSNRYVTVASPICGCGRTSRPVPGGSAAGPM